MFENSGIYLAICKVNNKIYVGSAINFKRRFSQHKYLLKNGRHVKYFQNAWNKHGEENFEFVIFESGIPPEDLLCWEQATMDFYESYLPEKGYNIRRFAESNFGINPSLESRARMSEAHKGKTPTEETRTRMKESVKNRPPITEKTLALMSEARKLIPLHSIETRKKILNNNIGKHNGENNPHSVLTIPQVREIKFIHLPAAILTQREIAKMYGVNRTTIQRIKYGKIWENIID